MWKVVQLEKYFDFSLYSHHFSLLSLTSLLSAPEREVTSPSDFKVVGALVIQRQIIHMMKIFWSQSDSFQDYLFMCIRNFLESVTQMFSGEYGSLQSYRCWQVLGFCYFIGQYLKYNVHIQFCKCYLSFCLQTVQTLTKTTIR